MHVVIFSPIYPSPEQPHLGTFVQQQAAALSKFHKVTVFAPYFSHLGELTVGRSEVEHIYRPRYLYIRGIWGLYYPFVSFWKAREIDWADVDVIHAHFSIPCGFTAVGLGLRYRKPVVLTEHAGDFEAWIAAPPRRRVMTWTMKQVRRIIVVSHNLQKRIEDHGVTGEFRVIPNIVDPEIFYPAPVPSRHRSEALDLLWVGRFEPYRYYRRKGGAELLQAVSLARHRFAKDIQLTMVGDGEARTEAETMAQKLGIADVCRFVGALPHIRVRDWMQSCDALVLSSRSESFGVVLAEAMACGKPVIATRCGGPEEFIVPKTGILVEPADPTALAKGIVRLFENYDAFNHKEIAAYAHRRFNPKRVATMITQVYDEVLELPVQGGS